MRLGQQALPQQMPKPRLSTLLDSFLQLLIEHGQQGGQPKLMPFWLPIRWCEPGMVPEQVRTSSWRVYGTCVKASLSLLWLIAAVPSGWTGTAEA
jgi:hypothetical protein